MSATIEQKFEELRRAYEDLRKEHDAALAQLQVRAAAPGCGNGLGASSKQTADRDFGSLKIENEELWAAQEAGLEVLQAMVASPGDTQPVFDLIARRAAELCAVPVAAVAMLDGAMLHLATQEGFDPAFASVYASQFPRPVGPDTVMGRTILSRRVEQIEDVDAEPAYGIAAPGPWSAMAVPLLRSGEPLGVIAVGRPVAGRFPDSLATLLQIFAEQAVIAITSAETYRALQERTVALAQRNTEYGERIEQQAATIDVLKVMSGSPDDPQPVFDQIAERARAFCGTDFGAVTLVDGDLIVLRALAGTESWVAQVRATYPVPISPASAQGRAILTRLAVRIPDTAADPEYTLPGVTSVMRSVAVVPMLRDGVAIGGIGIGGPIASPFSDIQMELLRTFAEQAVIAIRSAETYRALQTRTADLQESLEYQTATSNVLKVISRSTFDLQPVLETLVETAARLCEADMAAIGRPDGDLWRMAASFGYPEEFEKYQQARGAYPLGPDSPTVAAKAMHQRSAIHIHDVTLVPDYPETFTKVGRQRTSLGVPLLRGGKAIGFIALARQRVEPFTERQIDLVSTFADQAVIAIENTRLLTEQREALEQQTATSEVLGVINSSPGDLKPVFDAILEKAHSLCAATRGAFVVLDGEEFQVATSRGLSERYVQILRDAHQNRTPSDEQSPREQLLSGASFVQRSGPVIFTGPIGRAGAELENVHAVLFVPLRRDGRLLGYITAYREQQSLFSEKQIAVLQSFAAQAVVAMENARLLTEQREALEQQTATAEVLQVINSSPGNLTPAFDAMLEKAMRLCEAEFGAMYTYDGKQVQTVAMRGIPAAFTDFRMKHPPQARAGSPLERMLTTKRPVHIPDVLADKGYEDLDSSGRSVNGLLGIRTLLLVPMRSREAVVGMIGIYYKEVRPYSHKQTALLENFAAQAVIAMENARLLNEQREALEHQTATAEVLQVINASPGDLVPVFDAILEKAHSLCGATLGSLQIYDGDYIRFVAVRGAPEALLSILRKGIPRPTTPAIPLDQTSQVTDSAELLARYPDSESLRAIVELGQVRTQLHVPLQKDGVVIGRIAAARREVRLFTDKQIALLENFAAQAVIAIENARLLNEQREALEQQTATAEVLQVINSSPSNLTPVFEAILEKAHKICGAVVGSLLVYEEGHVRAAATHGFPAQFDWLVRQSWAPTAAHQSLMSGARCVHIIDQRLDEWRPGLAHYS